MLPVSWEHVFFRIENRIKKPAISHKTPKRSAVSAFLQTGAFLVFPKSKLSNERIITTTNVKIYRYKIHNFRSGREKTFPNVSKYGNDNVEILGNEHKMLETNVKNRGRKFNGKVRHRRKIRGTERKEKSEQPFRTNIQQ